MTDTEAAKTLEVKLADDVAAREIAKAVNGRRSKARKYVLWLRRWHPGATPTELIQMLERHYGAWISGAGILMSVGTAAANFGITLIPDAGVIAGGVKVVAKESGKVAAKAAAQQVAALLPTADAQTQFEITAMFGLAVSEIHGMDLDLDQAEALVYGLSNGRVSQQQIATMTDHLAQATRGEVLKAGRKIAASRPDWAKTLADELPEGAARDLIRTIQTGLLHTEPVNSSGQRTAAIQGGAVAIGVGVTRFVFGREIVASARVAFGAAPTDFPANLALPAKAKTKANRQEVSPNGPFAAVGGMVKRSGIWIADSASTVEGVVAARAVATGAGIRTAVGSVSRRFRRADLDRIPHEKQLPGKANNGPVERGNESINLE